MKRNISLTKISLKMFKIWHYFRITHKLQNYKIEILENGNKKMPLRIIEIKHFCTLTL